MEGSCYSCQLSNIARDLENTSLPAPGHSAEWTWDGAGLGRAQDLKPSILQPFSLHPSNMQAHVLIQ